ncbi:hypothetical protein PCE1_002126 [Barthelona sp. PCE]
MDIPTAVWVLIFVVLAIACAVTVCYCRIKMLAKRKAIEAAKVIGREALGYVKDKIDEKNSENNSNASYQTV